MMARLERVRSAAGERRFHVPVGATVNAKGQLVRTGEKYPVSRYTSKIEVAHLNNGQVQLTQHIPAGLLMTRYPKMAQADKHIDAILDENVRLHHIYHVMPNGHQYRVSEDGDVAHKHPGRENFKNLGRMTFHRNGEMSLQGHRGKGVSEVLKKHAGVTTQRRRTNHTETSTRPVIAGQVINPENMSDDDLATMSRGSSSRNANSAQEEINRRRATRKLRPAPTKVVADRDAKYPWVSKTPNVFHTQQHYGIHPNPKQAIADAKAVLRKMSPEERSGIHGKNLERIINTPSSPEKALRKPQPTVDGAKYSIGMYASFGYHTIQGRSPYGKLRGFETPAGTWVVYHDGEDNWSNPNNYAATHKEAVRKAMKRIRRGIGR